MTELSSPNPADYDFQYKEVCQAPTQIKEILDSNGNELDTVIVYAKVIAINQPKFVGQRNLKLMTATLSDNSGKIQFDLWEDHIEKVHCGLVYRFSPLQVNQYYTFCKHFYQYMYII